MSVRNVGASAWRATGQPRATLTIRMSAFNGSSAHGSRLRTLRAGWQKRDSDQIRRQVKASDQAGVCSDASGKRGNLAATTTVGLWDSAAGKYQMTSAETAGTAHNFGHSHERSSRLMVS